MSTLNKILTFTSLSIIATSCQTVQQADKALYGLANSVTSQDLVTGARNLSSADRSKQISQGNKAANSFVNKYRTANKKLNAELDSKQYARAKNIFSRVLKVSHLRDEKWQLFLIPEDSFNAFVTGGTTVFVHLGLMKQLKTDDEVAAVLAHEIAHVSANHVFERQASQMASLVGGSKSSSKQSVQAGYSTNDEVEADKIGVLYTALAGYNPQAAVTIWQNIYRSRGNSGQMYSTHPISSDRINNNTQYASKVKKYYSSGKINPNYKSILQNNSLWQKKSISSGVQAGSGGGVAAVLETLGNYYVDKQKAKQQASAQTKRIGDLKYIQDNMKILGAKMREDDFEMTVKYTGNRQINKVAIQAVSENKKASIYRVPSLIRPQASFKATFNKNLLDKKPDGTTPRLKLLIDEAVIY